MRAPFSRKKPPIEKDFQTPRVVFQPQTAQGLQSGFDQLVNVIRPTLGPLPRTVANEHVAARARRPEILDSGGTIARRIIQVPNRDQDVGLMYLRHILWKLQEAEGDGTATAAVMFQSIYNRGRRYVVAGGSAMILRKHLEHGMRLILNALEGQVTQIQGKQTLSGLARTICYDDELANMLGEIFDIIGAYGRLEVREGSTRDLIREYVEGMYWDVGLRSRAMANANHGLRANLENTAVLISDLKIETPEELVPLLTLCVRNNIKHLLLVSATLSEKAMGLLLTKTNQEKVHVAAVKTPGLDVSTQRDALQDLAILTGGRALMTVTNDQLTSVKLEDLGRARRAWVDNHSFGIVGGRGQPRVLRQHIADLRKALSSAKDGKDRKHLQERIGKLMGGSATLYVGGMTPTDIDARVELAKRTADAMPGAMREGVVPGGGLALLNCREPLRACLNKAENPDERAAYTILLEALEVPFRTIVTNAGFNAGKALAQVEQAGPGYVFDILARQVSELRESGVYDSAAVVKGAVRSAISGAALGLTTEAVIHRKNPPEGINT